MTTTTTEGPTVDFDPIEMEILRARVQAIADEAADTIYRTSISPVVTEGNDFSATLLDADGNLVAGGGFISLHWVAATRVAATIVDKFGPTIADGDVFFINDPYNGGGLHPSDVFVARPIFAQGDLVAWICLSAHMVDVGGLAMGSFAPAAHECYQEGFRVPAVRIFRQGEECTDIWDLLRVNVRLSAFVEMDMRGLVAGAHVAHAKAVEIVDSMGIDAWNDGVSALRRLTENELRRRISLLPDGVYRSSTWTQWGDELLETPCAMTIDSGAVTFNFEGSADQVPFFINSQPYIILSSFLSWFCPQYLPDLPYNQGTMAPFKIECPEATIVNAAAPAPMGAGHMHVAFNATNTMMQCMRMAMWASDPQFPNNRICGWDSMSALGITTFGGVDARGNPDGWMFMEGALPGSPAAWGHDGEDAAVFIIPTYGIEGPDTPPILADIEINESLHPILIMERRLRPDVGAGRWRSGRGLQMRVQTYETEQLTGQMLGMRGRLPLEGAAGGLPGVTTEFSKVDANGNSVPLRLDQSDVVIAEGESFVLLCASGGGVGDPLDRGIGDIEDDLANLVMDAESAATHYGVVFDAGGNIDPKATDNRRIELRRERLATATPAVAQFTDDVTATGEDLPLYPGVVQRGRYAIAEESGAILAVAPHHWTDGCPTVEWPQPGDGAAVVQRGYLDPKVGRLLHVEAVPLGAGRSFEVSPARWTKSA